MFSLKHVKCLSCKFQIVTAWWARAWERRKGLLVFRVSYIKTPANSPWGVDLTFVFQKVEFLLGDTQVCGWGRKCLRDAALCSPWLWLASSVLFSRTCQHLTVGWTLTALPIITKLISHLPCQTRSSSWFWINSFHVTLCFSKAQIRSSSTWSALSHPVDAPVSSGPKI